MKFRIESTIRYRIDYPKHEGGPWLVRAFLYQDDNYDALLHALRTFSSERSAKRFVNRFHMEARARAEEFARFLAVADRPPYSRVEEMTL